MQKLFSQLGRWVFSEHIFELVALFCAGVGFTIAMSPSIEDINRAHWFFGVAFVLATGRGSRKNVVPAPERGRTTAEIAKATPAESHDPRPHQSNDREEDGAGS